MPVFYLEIIVVVLGLVMLMVDAFVKLEDKRHIAWIGVLGLICVFFLLFKVEWPTTTESTFWKFYDHEEGTRGFSLFYKGIAVLCTIIVLIMGAEFRGVIQKYIAPPEPGAHPQSGLGEFFALPVFACAGLMWMASASNLVSIFVALETVTITFYVLVAYMRRNVGSLEAGVKYLILGALSTGFLVYGFTWLFGITGSMDLAEIKTALASENVNVAAALFAFGLIIVGLGFKVGAAPFQLWIPDVYQGAPTPITAFLSVASKSAGFIVLLRIAGCFLSSAYLSEKIGAVLVVIAILTLLYGNLAALPQKNFKRLLAYSSIAHAGFLLMALASPPGKSGGLNSPAVVISFYLGAYLLMTLLAFLVMTAVRNTQEDESVDAYAGLARRSPFLAFALLIAMASLAGIPLTAGFFGKFFVFKLAFENGASWILIAAGIIGAAAGFYYYLKIVASMYWAEGDDEADSISVSIPSKVTMVLLMIGILVAGVVPNAILSLLG
ncbi:MAG: NADH-quinone oxidoreductase subunit N [Verrucomicrobiales bacterium]|nr:NADH-quinone oxidoreductase subunit N [Verrucomicrobiales bacterium]